MQNTKFVITRIISITCCSILLATFIELILSQEALASEHDIIGKTLCNLVDVISGQIARGIATLAIFAVGVGLFMGKVSWGLAATTAGGVAVVFGASSLVDFFAVDDAGTCPENATPPAS